MDPKPFNLLESNHSLNGLIEDLASTLADHYTHTTPTPSTITTMTTIITTMLLPPPPPPLISTTCGHTSQGEVLQGWCAVEHVRLQE